MPQIEFSSGFLFFLALLAQFDGFGIFLPYLAAAALHELGHALVLYAFSGRVTRLRFGFGDIKMDITPLAGAPLFFCAMAGPCVNLFCGIAFARRFSSFAAISLLLGGYNLLPLCHLDGGLLLFLLLRRLFPRRGGAAARKISGLFAAFLLLLSVYAALSLRLGVLPMVTAAFLALRAHSAADAGLHF